MNRPIVFAILLTFLLACNTGQKPQNDLTKNTVAPFVWENANVYFLLTDRFFNGNPNNDVNFNRTAQAGPERGFQGGDFKGITQKINDGYFTSLGITALWFSPIFEQIHGNVDEGAGVTFAFHGYWTRDFSRIEPNFGTEQEFAELVDAAHANGIRIIMDVILNHTGPVTDVDPFWGNDWARTEPQCNYQSYESTVECTLVKNLPDIKTESNQAVTLPNVLMEKFESEGRLKEELESLEAFFNQTGYSRAPRYYIIKWLVDFIKKYGIDGFRIDTVKHVDASAWAELATEAQKAFKQWKLDNPDKVLDENDFYLIGEVYGYGISSGQVYNNGGVDVNYFESGMQSLINFEFKYNARELSYEQLFDKYSQQLHTSLKGYSVLNYLASHDDGQPFSADRTRAIEGGTKLLLCPGKSQIYYGDETNRSLILEGVQGDATLRGFMNWDEMTSDSIYRGDCSASDLLLHYQKLGKFRAENPAVGAGINATIQKEPYVFGRSFQAEGYTNNIVVAINIDKGKKSIPVSGYFADGEVVVDAYSGIECKVKKGIAIVNSDFDIVLLNLKK